MLDITKLIIEATKEKSEALDTYKLIKAEFLRWTKDNPNKEFTEAVEQKILKKMYDQRMESFKVFTEAGREDLARIEKFGAEIISAYLPKEVPPEELILQTKMIIKLDYNDKVSMKDMKTILSKVQEIYPGASGKIVSQVVKSYAG